MKKGCLIIGAGGVANVTAHKCAQNNDILGEICMDTAIHEDPGKICESPPWYANYEWKHRGECREKGVTAILGVGFDPGVVNAYCSYAQKHYFDRIETIDIYRPVV